jgi:hypothetical protein
MRFRLRSLVLLTVGVLGLGGAAAAPAGAAAHASAAAGEAHTASHLTAVYRNLHLLNGDTATVYSNGVAEVWNRTHSQVEYRMIPPDGAGQPGTAAALPGQAQLSFDLLKAPAQPYVAGQLEVVLSPAVSATSATVSVPAATLRRLQRYTARPGALPSGTVPAYTSDAAFNRVLAGLGVDRMSAVFPSQAMRTLRAQPGGLDLAKAYVVDMTGGTMAHALAALTSSGAVAYAAPDWTVSSTATSPLPVPAATLQAATRTAHQLAQAPAAQRSGGSLPALPSNFALQASAQSLLNKPGLDWTPAYEALEAKYHQLPGTGETITDVSLGDLDSAGIPSTDHCYGYVSAFGPTTIVQNGQRYLDWPSMPLIPTYVSSSSATIDPTGEVCGVDPYDEEIGLDFAMMAPLPDSLQRAGETGSGLTDLLGIAPGAKYRLVVPSDTTGAITSIDEAFLAAAQQTPRPNVITASLAFGEDSYGFPSRYLEDDPLTEALISSLVGQYHINVSIAANDGLRTSTNATVAPSGGSAPTDTEPAGGTPSNLNSIYLSTMPSRDYDSGAIDAGGTTLDDVFAEPPQDPGNVAFASQHAFPETRWDGYGSFSSGYGSRVNLSAPADNLTAFEHTFGGAADAVTVDNIGGTSGSAQEVGAAAAVVQQAARLAGDKSVATSPLALRAELEKTAAPVPGVPQADTALNVGPQLDLGQAVTSLTGAAGGGLAPGVARVAVEQRQPYPGYTDEVFSTATDPGDISLAGVDQDAYITISPDWVGLPAGAVYKLYAVRETGGQRMLATGPWARLQPDAIFRAAGVSPPTAQSQAVALSYTASVGGQGRGGGKIVARATIPLSFSPVSGTAEALAPVVPPVTRGATIPVHYNLAGQSGFTAPQLVVSAPGRMNPLNDLFFRPLYTASLAPQSSGTVNVPVSALQGGGMYGIAIQATPDTFAFSDFAYTRVQDAPSDVRPAAPVLSAPGSPPGYLQVIPYGGKFTAQWDVRDVPGATGAYLEISAPGPNDWNSFATFNNPDGTIRDDNGYDSGSVYYARLPGTAGKVTISGTAAGLVPTMYSNVRVLPVTASGTAAGEASDVSTISMNGVTPADGGSPLYGFGVAASGSQGFVTSNGAVNDAGQPVSSVETFSQKTNAITGTAASSVDSDSYATLDDGGPGIFAGNTGLINDSTATTSSYDILHPVGTVTGPWNPPTSNSAIQPADNQQTPAAAFVTWGFGSTGDDDAGVFSSDVAAGTFSPVYSIEPVIKGFGVAVLSGIAQNTATDTAVVGASDFTNLSVPPTYIEVNLASGAVSTFTGVGQGYPEGVAVDSGTDTAASPDTSGVGLYDLATGSGTLASPGGFIYQHPAADAAHHEFVMQEVSSPDENLTTPGLGAVPNNNARSSMVVLNEQGQVLSRIEQFNFFNVFTSVAGQLTQLAPASQQGYTLGLYGDELQPFSY